MKPPRSISAFSFQLSAFSFLLAVLVTSGLAQDVTAEPPPFEPVTLTLTGTPHPQARVTSADAKAGTFVFAWLDAKGKPVDSGGSIGRFTPSDPVALPTAAQLRAGITQAAAPQEAGEPAKTDKERIAELEAKVAELEAAK